MNIQIIAADRFPIVLSGLENLFRPEKDCEIIACCTDGSKAMEALRANRPDVAILDFNLPGKDGLAIAREIRAEKLPTRVVFFTADIEEDLSLEAMRVGVRGIVLKDMAPEFLVRCIRKVHAGEQWLERRTAGLAFEKLLRREAAALEVAARLTPQEIAISRMISQGLRNKQIAEKICISDGTVKVHLHNIFEKLGVKGRLELMRYAQQKGLV